MFGDEEKTSRKPDFSSNKGCAVWLNKDKNGKDYLAVRIPLLNISVNCFKVEQEVDLSK